MRPGETRGVVEELEGASRLEAPSMVTFEWRLNDAGSRIRGRGVARMEPPYRVRLDLFTENGETAARAALVGEDLRLPAEVDRRLIPPAPLLWAAFGVFHPGGGAELLGGGSHDDGDVVLRYRVSEDREIHYRSREGSLRSAELLRDGHAEHRVRLQGETGGTLPREATYRDLAEFRELEVSVETIERAESFSPEIWHPGR